MNFENLFMLIFCCSCSFFKEVNLCLNPNTMDENLWKYSKNHWFMDGYNLVLLSRLYNKAPDVLKMFKVFSNTIWTLLLLATILMTGVVYSKQIIMCEL